jgi:hypothetical protein
MNALRSIPRWYVYGALWTAALVVAALLWPDRASWSSEDQWRRLDFTVQADSSARNTIDVGDLGVPPLAAAMHRTLHAAGERTYRLTVTALAISGALLLTLTAHPAAWLLLPFAMSALIPGEYAVITLLAWPLLLLLTGARRPGGLGVALAAVLAAPAAALAPSLIPVIIVLLFQAGACGWSREAIFGALGWGVTTAFLTTEFAAKLPITAALSWPNLTGNLRMLASLDTNAVVSIVILLSWAVGVYALRREARAWRIAGGVVLAVGGGWYIVRLWMGPAFSAQLADHVSLVALAPWILLSGFPPYRGRSLLLPIAIAVGFVLCALHPPDDPLALPVSAAVLLPLWLMDLKKNDRDRGPAFVGLVMLTLLNTLSFAVAIGDRAAETASHVRLLEPRTGSPLLIAPPELGFEVAPLWNQREVYGVHDQADLFGAASAFRHSGVDTFYLLLEAHDPLYVQTFPNAKPVWPNQMTVTNGGVLHPSQLRLYKLVTNPTDSLWQTLGESAQ